jgi:hypothetical protein
MDNARQGTFSLASITLLTTGKIDRRQQESRRIIDENVLAEFYALSALGDHRHARLVSHRAWSGRGGPAVERQPRNIRCPVLCGANEQGNLASQLYLQFVCWIC